MKISGLRMKKIEKVNIIKKNIIPNVILFFLNLISKSIKSVNGVFIKITHNVPRLHVVGDLEAQNFQPYTKIAKRD